MPQCVSLYHNHLKLRDSLAHFQFESEDNKMIGKKTVNKKRYSNFYFPKDSPDRCYLVLSVSDCVLEERENAS